MPTILVVDDEPSIRELLRRILETAGYIVVTAHDAPSALTAAAEHDPHVAFLDVHMPGADGLWLANQFRDQFPTVATVLATGDVNISPFENVRRGIIQYLTKPFRPDEVLSAAVDGIQWAAALRDMQH